MPPTPSLKSYIFRLIVGSCESRCSVSSARILVWSDVERFRGDGVMGWVGGTRAQESNVIDCCAFFDVLCFKVSSFLVDVPALVEYIARVEIPTHRVSKLSLIYVE